MNALELSERLTARPDVYARAAAEILRRQHEAVQKLREALESMCEGDFQAIIDAEALGIPFPDEMLTEYRKAQQALKDTEEFK